MIKRLIHLKGFIERIFSFILISPISSYNITKININTFHRFNKIKNLVNINKVFYLYSRLGSNQHSLREPPLKSGVSTNSTTRAFSLTLLNTYTISLTLCFNI